MFEWICPVCKNKNNGEFPSSNVCDFCNWEQDAVQEHDSNYRGGANKESLNEARAVWHDKQAAEYL